MSSEILTFEYWLKFSILLIVTAIGIFFYMKKAFTKDLNIGIYMLKHKNKILYIGQSKHLKTRKSQHFNALNRNKHFNKGLQSYYKKNKNIEFKIILICDKKNLDYEEVRLINLYKPFFNKKFNNNGISRI